MARRLYGTSGRPGGRSAGEDAGEEAGWAERSGMSRRGWVLFAAMCVIWGIPYLLIKVAVGELAPATMVLGRTAIGAALLLPFAMARGKLRGLRAAWLPLVVYTAVEICGPWLLLGFAETRLSSSMTGLLIAGVPLVGLDLGSTDAAALAALGLVAVGYAIGPMILARQLSHLPGLGVVAASLALSAVLYLPWGIAQAPHAWPSARVVAAVAALAVVCTAVAFVLFLQLIAEVGPARATVITYVNPAVAILLGVLVLGEPFTAAIGIGFILVLGGSVLATSGSRTGAPVPGEAATAGRGAESYGRVPAGGG